MTALEPVKPWRARIAAPSQAALRGELARAHRRGELAASGPMYRLAGGGYAVEVYRLKDRLVVSAWRKPVLVAAGAAVVLGAAAAVGWWLVPGGVFLLAGASLLTWVSVRPSRGYTTTITIRHRGH